jgi:hypothetical protein
LNYALISSHWNHVCEEKNKKAFYKLETLFQLTVCQTEYV